MAYFTSRNMTAGQSLNVFVDAQIVRVPCMFFLGGSKSGVQLIADIFQV